MSSATSIDPPAPRESKLRAGSRGPDGASKTTASAPADDPGLRPWQFFVLAGMMDRFVYLKPGVALILIFVGTKMTLSHWVHLPITASLAVILLILTGAVLLSLRRTAPQEGMPA